MLIVGVLLIVVGWGALIVAVTPRVVRDGLEPGTSLRRARSRILGAGALAASPAPFVVAYGVEQGPVYWAAALMIGAVAVVVVRALRAPAGGKDGQR